MLREAADKRTGIVALKVNGKLRAVSLFFQFRGIINPFLQHPISVLDYQGFCLGAAGNGRNGKLCSVVGRDVHKHGDVLCDLIVNEVLWNVERKVCLHSGIPTRRLPFSQKKWGSRDTSAR